MIAYQRFAALLMVFPPLIRNEPKWIRWVRLSKITLPMLTPVVLFNLILQVINGFRAFTENFIINKADPWIWMKPPISTVTAKWGFFSALCCRSSRRPLLLRRFSRFTGSGRISFSLQFLSVRLACLRFAGIKFILGPQFIQQLRRIVRHVRYIPNSGSGGLPRLSTLPG